VETSWRPHAAAARRLPNIAAKRRLTAIHVCSSAQEQSRSSLSQTGIRRYAIGSRPREWLPSTNRPSFHLRLQNLRELTTDIDTDSDTDSDTGADTGADTDFDVDVAIATAILHSPVNHVHIHSSCDPCPTSPSPRTNGAITSPLPSPPAVPPVSTRLLPRS